MKKSNDFLSEPSRQSVVAIILILLRFVKGLVRSFWPILLVFLFRPGKGGSDWFSLLFIGLSGISVVLSIISYYKFYFYVSEEDLVIEKGVLRKTKLSIPFDRVQTVNFQQNIIHQLFNVVGVEIDTAGSKGSEFEISALSREKAEALREYVLSRRNETLREHKESTLVEEEQELMLRLSPGDLVKIGISQNHFKTAGIIFGFFLGLLTNIEEAIDMDIEDMYKDYIGLDIESLMMSVLMVIPFFIFLAFLVTLVFTVMRYFDLKLWKTNRGFKIVAGLFNRREQTALYNKIQIVRWSTNPLKKLFKMSSLQLKQAAADNVGAKQSIRVPGVYNHELDKIKDLYFPAHLRESMTLHRISKLVILRYTLFFGVIPAAVISGVRYFMEDPYALYYLILIPLVYLLVRVYWQKRTISINSKLLRSHSGIIADDDEVIYLYKVQAVRIRQSIYQRRKNLATMHLYTAAGSVNLPYIPLSLAKQLRDFVLYKVESTNRKWM